MVHLWIGIVSMWAFPAHATPGTEPLRGAEVRTRQGTPCTAYLYADPHARDLPLVAKTSGTGVYTTADGLARTEAALVETREAAYVTVDKPGIHATNPGTDAFTVEDDVYNRYSPTDLADCLYGAIHWAHSQPEVAPEGPLVLRGHSEGAGVVLQTALILHENNQDTNLRGILTSGTPIGSFTEQITEQAGKAGAKRLYEAALAGDDAYLRDRASVGAAAFIEMVNAPPIQDILATAEQAGLTAPIQMFHGERDDAVPVATVKTYYLEQWQRPRSADRRNLHVSLRVYPGCLHLPCPAMSADLQAATRMALHPLTTDPPNTTPVDLPVSADEISRFSGRYRMFGVLMALDATVRGEQLLLQADNDVIVLHRQDDVRFQFAHLPAAEIVFSPEAGRFALVQGETRIPFRRTGKSRFAPLPIKTADLPPAPPPSTATLVWDNTPTTETPVHTPDNNTPAPSAAPE